MSYKAIYRKYRPATFNDVVGQQHVIQTITNAIEQERLAHAYLFCGPSGNGKTSVAKLFAKAVNCETDDEIICGRCSNCEEIKNNIHPDVVEIDAASNNGVDEIRNIIEKVKYAPIKGKYKIYIIDEVHMLSLGAFNALLKTLEEPPAHVIFILATTEPHKVIPTIISRCQRYDFTRVKQKDIYNNIIKILKLEGISYQEDAIQLISELADGGVRNSLSILEQCVAYSADQLNVEDVRKIYGIVTKAEKLAFIHEIINKDIQTSMRMLEKISEQGNDLERFNKDLIDIFKEAVVYYYAQADDILLKTNEIEAKDIIDRLTPTQMLAMIDILLESDRSKKNIADLESFLELSIIKMISIVDASGKQFVTKATNIETTIEATPTPNTVQNMADVAVEVKESQETATPEKVATNVIEEPRPVEMNTQKVEQVVKDANVNTEVIQNETFDIDYYLSLLAHADKEKRIQMSEKWKDINNYINDLAYAKYAQKLKDSSILAIGENYIVVVVDNQYLADEMNDKSNEAGFIKMFEIAYQVPHKVFAISSRQADELISLFKERAANNDLPAKTEIVLSQDEVITESIETKVEQLFNTDEFIVVEEE